MIFQATAPSFEQIVKAIETVGGPIVLTVLILLIVVSPLVLLLRLIISGLGTQISGAVTLFSGTLSLMSTRQEEASDRMAQALTENTHAIQKLGELVSSMNESVRIQLTFTTQQMAQQAALTQQVAHVAQNTGVEAATGILKPVEGGST